MATSSNSSRVIFFVALSFLVITITPISFAFGEEFEVSLLSGSSIPGCEYDNSCFVPYAIKIDTSDTVTWVNDDTAAHTVTSGTGADGPDGNFDSSLFMAGTTFEHTFDESGTYEYFCMVHPWMVGVVVVNQGDGGPSIPPESESFPFPPPNVLKITVYTDRPYYLTGDKIIILGSVGSSSESLPDIPVTIMIIGPDSNLAAIGQVPLDQSGKFSHAILAGPPMYESGIYEVTAKFGAQEAFTTFTFTASDNISPPPKPEPVEEQEHETEPQTDPVITNLTTNKNSYTEGDSIVISGHIDNHWTDYPARLHVDIANGGSLLPFDAPIDSNGDFITKIIAGGPEWTTEGTYTLGVIHVAGSFNAYTTFDFSFTEGESPQQPSLIIQKDVQEKVELSNLQFVDSSNNIITEFVEGDFLQVSALIKNLQNKEQPFVYLVQVQDTNGYKLPVRWITGSLSAGQSFSPTLSWTPDEPGTYSVTAFVQESVDDPTRLAQPIEKNIFVQDNEPASTSGLIPAPTPEEIINITPAPTPILAPTQNDDLSGLVQENQKLKEELERQIEQIDELNLEINMLKQIIQDIQGFFGSLFG